MSPRANNPEHSAAVEASILDAARDLLAEGGAANLSMRAVGDRVGMTAPAIYRYFPGKDALVDRVVRQGFQRFDQALDTAMQSRPRGSLERLRALGEAYVRFALEHQAFFRVLFSIQPHDPKEVADLPAGGGYDRLRQSVADAIQSGALRETDADHIAHYLWVVAHGLVTLSLTCRLGQCQHEPGRGPDGVLELFDAFMPLVFEGLRPRETDRRPRLFMEKEQVAT